MSIEQNITDRQLFDEVVAMRPGKRFFQLMVDHFTAETGEHFPEVMNALEAQEFGNKLMPWGLYVGTEIKSVPVPYLEAVADTKFTNQLKRYLRSLR